MGLIAHGIIALVLVAAGGVLYSAGGRERALAEVERELAALHYDAALARLADAGGPSWIDRTTGLSRPDASRLDASIAYWAQDDAALDAQQQPLLAANAAFRQVRREGGDWKTVVTRLDEVVKRYGDILRAEPGHLDAAYNFEFAARYRAAVAALRQAIPPGDDGGLTLHGVAGAPPRGTDMKQFKMIVPMQPNERQEAEQAGRAGVRRRKG